MQKKDIKRGEGEWASEKMFRKGNLSLCPLQDVGTTACWEEEKEKKKKRREVSRFYGSLTEPPNDVLAKIATPCWEKENVDLAQ